MYSHRESLRCYHYQKVQSLGEADPVPRRAFCEWLIAHPDSVILWTDEALFTRVGLYNQHNEHWWSYRNPHVIREHHHQVRFSANVWAGIVAMLRDLTKLTQQIIRHTVISRAHLTPEMPLRLVTPACPLWGAREEELPFPDPFWAFYWPGGQAAARYILDNGNVVENRRVIDIGCGCGAGAIAAAIMKAKRVLANDIDPYALAASKVNADLNKVNFELCMENFIGEKLEDFDTILIGDMFYDEEFANYLFEWLRTLATDGKTILIGDPGRHGLTEKRRRHITQLARYKMPDDSCSENHGFTETSLWRMNKD